MKPWIKWGLLALTVALLAVGIGRALANRKAQQTALAEQTAKTKLTVVELAASDVLQATTRELTLGLPISGSLKAVNSAVIKAKVAGELQDLSLREGDPVQQGQVVARVDPTEYVSRLKQAQQQSDAAQAQIDMAQRQFDNNRALVDQGFISKTALDTSSSTLVAAQATYRATQAAAEVAKKSLDDTVLRSPLSGTVSQRLAQPGERVAVDGRVLEVVDLSRLELEATLSAAESVSVRVGLRASLQIEGVGHALAAQVVRISPSTQAGSRSVLAYLRLEQPAGLRQGLFAQGSLNTERVSGLALPLASVRTDKPAPYVQVVEGGVVVHKAVTVRARGSADDVPMALVQGLSEGAVVISGQVGALPAGSSVKITPAAR